MDAIAALGFHAVWLMGGWRRGVNSGSGNSLPGGTPQLPWIARATGADARNGGLAGYGSRPSRAITMGADRAVACLLGHRIAVAVILSACTRGRDEQQQSEQKYPMN